MADRVRIAEDRSMVVPPGALVRTAYVPVDDVVHASRVPIAMGDLERARHRLLGILPAQPWPPPVGHWRGSRFVVRDGRHQVEAARILGLEHVLVAWMERV